MPNQVDANGLQVKTVTEITADLDAGLAGIYGADINVEQNSPDGQQVGIFAQAVADMLQLLVQVYNTFSVDNTFGVSLDQRVALNGIARHQGTHTLAQVLVTVDQALTLIGQDALIVTPNAQVFTVADDAGNQFQLETTNVFGGAGSASLTFVAVAIGQVQTTANTITNQVTTVLGVTSVNNPTVAGDVIGLNEESDIQLKIRRALSFQLAAVGPSDALRAMLLSLPDISDAYVVENDTGGVVDTVPAHSIWTIVNGGTNAEIGQAIYSKKIPGCGQKGAQTYIVTRPAGNTFTAQWDVALTQDLFVEFGITPRIAGLTFDNASIKTQLAAALVYKLGQKPNSGDVVVAMQTIAPNAILTSCFVSIDGSTWVDIVTPSTAQHYFTLDAANITIL